MAPTEDRRPPGILLFVLIAAMAAGPVLNYGLSALSPQIIETYDITEGQYGLIITIVFLIAGLSATVLGALSDRMPVRLQLTLVFGLMAVAFLVSISAPTYAALLTAAVIAAVACAGRGIVLSGNRCGVLFEMTRFRIAVALLGNARDARGVGVMDAVRIGVTHVLDCFALLGIEQASTQTLVVDHTAATE